MPSRKIEVLPAVLKILPMIFSLGTFIFFASGTINAQIKISYAEYFIDNDPGYRKAKSIAITPSVQLTDIPVSFNVDTLPQGLHTFVVRTADENGVWSLDTYYPFLKPFTSSDTIIAKANINYVEYFVNTDPGVGQAQALSLVPGTEIKDLIISIDTSQFFTGINKLGVRTKDAKGNWSLTQHWLFLKPSKTTDPADTVTTKPVIDYIEYYLNTDPGQGKANSLLFTSGADVGNLLISIDTADLHSGINTVGVRAKDAKGSWSLIQNWFFLRPFDSVDTVPVKPNITYAEYFIDKDPGFGKAITIPFTAGLDLNNLIISLDSSEIDDGLHTLFVRAKDAKGSWSLVSNWLFFKPVTVPVEGDTVPRITYIEYFQGSDDPGFGKATAIAFNPGNTISNLAIPLDTADLQNGINRITVRARNAEGDWGLNQIYLFYKHAGLKDTVAPVSKISYLEYYIDNDPGVGKGTPVTIPAASDISNLVIPINIIGWEVGNYNFYLRAVDSLGNWSLVNKWSFKIEVPSGYILTLGQINDTICAGQTVRVPFSVNASFGTTNVFTAQLSNAAGSFTNSVNIGSLSGVDSDTIVATIPSNAIIGNNYRIRVVASSPTDTSIESSGPLTIRRLPLQFSLVGKTTVCKVSEDYYATSAEGSNVSYRWSLSTGGTISPNGSTATVTWATGGIHTLKLSSFNYCGLKTDSLLVEVIDTALTGPFTNMLPSDSNRNLSFPITFSWFPITNATAYDIYIWLPEQTRPLTPFISNITSINYTLFSGLQYEKYYKWQVVAKRACYVLESPVQTFQLRYLSDLIVNDIQIPSTGFSGQNLSVSWEVKNIGQGSTLNQQWFDLVYFSHDAIFDNTDVLLGSVSNQSELAPGASYLQTGSFRLPQGINDNYYILINTNPYGQVQENNRTNNTRASTSTVFVQLTPPPDLQVTSIVLPNFSFSGEAMDVTWKVTNMGNGGTISSQWTDYIYLSPDSILNFANAQYMGSYTRTTSLPAQESYSRTQKIQLPVGMQGKHYVYILTDVFQQVFEHASENNNTGRSDTFNVLLTPPINLLVTSGSITLPSSGSNLENLTVKWKVENAGGSSTIGKYWTDKIYLSKAATFKRDSVIHVGSLFHSSLLNQGDFYDAQVTIQVPGNISGDFYTYVRTDADSIVFEHTFETDNIARSTTPLLVLSPDLIVSSLGIPATDSSGSDMEVTYGIKNNGPGVLVNATVTDRILLSTSATFNPSSVIVLKAISYNMQNLANGDTIARSTSVTLPEGLSGSYYVYVQTDFSNAVFENVNENNNVGRSASLLNIALAPWPDLRVSDIQIPDTATAADIIPLTFSVANAGEAQTSDTSWTDRIYFSVNSTFDPAGSILIRDIVRSQPLKKDSSYFVNTTVKIPGNIAEGNYYVHVITDAGAEVYEHTDEANNITTKGFLYIKKYPPVDLNVTSISAPANGNSGKAITVNYSVENKGIVTTLQNNWHDALYLSTDTVWDKNNDLLVQAVQHIGDLQPGGSYSNTQNFVLPNGISGNYYLLLVADHDDVNRDVNRLNNFRLIKSGNNNTTINVSLTPPSDLIVSSLKVPDNGTAGQPIIISWKVKNTGSGSTNNRIWTEKVFLSNNLTLDGNDQMIGSFNRADSLIVNEEYVDSLQVFLPNNASGNYVVIFKTDANDNVYEHQNENNNTAYSLITIEKPALSDIVAADIIVPAIEVLAGEEVKIEWKIKNIGANPATGYLKHAVYLSLDTIKDISDILLTSFDDYINLAPQAEVSASITREINGVALRDYYGIVHTDILNNIIESNDTNNVSFSVQKLKVTVPELLVNINASRSLSNNKEVYYRIEIPDSLLGESLLITLKGDSVNGSNEMYLRHNEVPTRVVYDYVHGQPYQGNQEVIVPDLKAGTYYLMLTGATTAGTAQSINVLAKILPFEIRSVNANKGGNTGNVTIQVNGSKLANVTAFRLTNGSVSLQADSIIIIDPTLVYATFNLNEAQLGRYDVVAENIEGATAVLPQGFEVVTGTVSNLVSNVIAPPSTRLSNLISLSVNYTNAGNTDLVNPVLKLSSLAGAPIGFSVTDLANNITELTLNLKEVNGPPGVLRPGASGTIIVYARASTVLSFNLIHQVK